MHGFDLVLRMVPLVKCPGVAAGGLEAVPPPDGRPESVAQTKTADGVSLPFAMAPAGREAAR